MDWSTVLDIVKEICHCAFYSILVICAFKYLSKMITEIIEKIEVSKTKQEILRKTEQNNKNSEETNNKNK